MEQRMNSIDVAWLEKLFRQHKEDQQVYLNAKFNSMGEKIDDVKEQVGELAEDIEDVEVVCTDNIDDIEKKINKRIIAGSVGAIIVTLSLWTIFGTDALAIVLRLLGGGPAF